MAVIEGNYTCEICGETFETNVAIAGHMGGHEWRVSREAILNAIRKMADALGRPPTSKEFDHESPPSTMAVRSEFESWNQALRTAGYEPHAQYRSKTELIEAIEEVAAIVGHPPTRDEMVEHGDVPPSVLNDRFGSWTEALVASGFEPRHQQAFSDTAVIDAIQSLAADLGKPPTVMDMQEHGSLSVSPAQRHFGSWNDALCEAGYNPHTRRGIPEEELQNELNRLADELGRPPSSIDMRRQGAHSVAVYTHRWGSWQEAVEAAGMEYRGHPSGPDHPLWKGGYGDISYGPNWSQQRKRALERDGFECQMSGCSVNREAHHERWNRDLNVHHITPLGSFIDADGILDYERGTDLRT